MLMFTRRTKRMIPLLLAALLLACAAPATEAAYYYRMDDVYGPSGIGAQWIVKTGEGFTRGAAADVTHVKGGVDIQTTANIVNSRDHVYNTNGTAIGMPFPIPEDPIHYIFMVIPGDKISMRVAFDWLNPNPGTSYTQDVNIGDDYFITQKTPLSSTSGPSKRFQFDMTKLYNQYGFETNRTYMRFHQNPDAQPSQTILIPFVIANVDNGTAEENPILFRSTMRETTSGRNGDIVAYNHFTWDVTADFEVGNNADWIFVPLKNKNIDYNTVEYDLTTDVTNYSGIRYALDRYDRNMSNKEVLYPSRWAMDLPSTVTDIDPEIVLDELSHMPPGLITTYVQKYNVVTATKGIFSMYPVDGSGLVGSPHNLTLVHAPVFGFDLGRESGQDYAVNGFELLPSDVEFLPKAARTLGRREAAMPNENHSVMSGAVEPGFVTADAVSTIAIDSKVPSAMMVSEDVAGLMPLHVTFNLPRSNRYIAPKWDAMMQEWKSTGKVRSLFARNFSLYAHSAAGENMDLFEWMRRHDAFERLVKVFMDEAKQSVTVSFVVMLQDDPYLSPALIYDRSVTTDNAYLALRDGKEDDRWNMTFFVAPADYTGEGGNEGEGSWGGGGGGGCDAGAIPAFAALCLCILSIASRRRQKP